MNHSVFYAYTSSPLGQLLLTSDGEGLIGLHFPGDQDRYAPGPEWRLDHCYFGDVLRQLDAYFAGELQEFNVGLTLTGSPFERRVWNELCRIPYGTTVSYREIAQRIGQPTAYRAVGLANGRNPIPIIVPCHRVIGSDGSLTGYGGGLQIKQWLLKLEGVEKQPLPPFCETG